LVKYAILTSPKPNLDFYIKYVITQKLSTTLKEFFMLEKDEDLVTYFVVYTYSSQGLPAFGNGAFKCKKITSIDDIRMLEKDIYKLRMDLLSELGKKRMLEEEITKCRGSQKIVIISYKELEFYSGDKK